MSTESSPNEIKTWTVEYETLAQVWVTTTEAYTREAAIERVKEENPGVTNIRGCWEAMKAN